MVKAAEDFWYHVHYFDSKEKDMDKLKLFKKGDTIPKEVLQRLEIKGPDNWIDRSDGKKEEEAPAKTILTKSGKRTEEEIFDLNKADQVKILEDLGLEVPRYEKDRVALILEKQ